MFSYLWPVAMIVFSNTMYQICAKSTSSAIDPMASLTVTYTVSAVFSCILYFVLNRGGNLLQEYTKLNWTPFVFGLVLVGLEVGSIYAYRNGWQVSTMSIVQSAFLAIALIFVGWLLFHESLTWNKLIGVAVVLVGLVIINYK